MSAAGTMPSAVQTSRRAWALFALIAALVVVSASAASIEGESAAVRGVPRTAANLLDTTGVRVTRVALVGGGGLIEIRYQVIDPERAEAIHGTDRQLVSVTDPSTGTVLDRPWMDHDHAGDFTAGVTYSQILVNIGGVIDRGEQVSVNLGDGGIDALTVE